ncbi:L,D-transpeptidase family protein [Methylobacter sp. S3L5C]|uniref:L,D-transpeptidase family protein n=1 Tax=Methylobacter sp. S3L5C TaxID=2839024 RepID=UPI001FAD38DC|nr:L,D-transpeptidase family protein [Methylobacter sp. S3L5C]UOA07759.1 L,D-transpeptidase family protein [Methylobacter sp. S3L5C]
MKALFALLVVVLLTGCGSLTLALKSVQRFYADLPKAKDVTLFSINKDNVSRLKTSAPAEALPPPPATHLTESISTPPATSTVAPTPPPDSGSFATFNVLKVGSQGDAVLALEKRLAELRYDVGAVDGYYDQQMWQGVVAFQKYARLKRTGTYTLKTQVALLKAVIPSGEHPEMGLPRIEINLTRQVLLFFDKQGLNRVIAVSTGSNRKYCEISKKSGERICGVARTPRGKFRIQWRISGWRESDLGKLYNPLYFNGGFAIHGSPLVPADNVSHGCVRISIATSQWLYENIKDGTPVIVFD